MTQTFSNADADSGLLDNTKIDSGLLLQVNLFSVGSSPPSGREKSTVIA